MDSKNPFIRLMIYGKLKKLITSFTGSKVKIVDKKLVEGVFVRKIKDFDEDFIDAAENKNLIEHLKGKLIVSPNNETITNSNENIIY